MSRRANTDVGRPPLRLLVPALAGLALLVLPLATLVASTPWSTIVQRLTAPEILVALRLSLVTSTAAITICFVLGLPLAWVLARVDFPGRSLLRAVVTVPLVLPPVVAGVALLTAFGRNGVLGGPLEACCGVTIPFTTAAVVLAHAFVALPFLVISVEGALRAANPEYDMVAATLGADRWTIFRTVTVPLAMPGIVAGLVLGWARSLGEFGATITFAGNFPGTTRTMPLAVYTALQSDPEAAIVLSVILLVVSIGVLALLRERWLAVAAG
jgi:molybdate transport system permease protein